MNRPKFPTVLGIALIGLILIALLLPVIAGLIEGDFGYVSWELDQGWNHKSNVTMRESISDIYAWSLWRIGLCDEPVAHLLYHDMQLAKKFFQGRKRAP